MQTIIQTTKTRLLWNLQLALMFSMSRTYADKDWKQNHRLHIWALKVLGEDHAQYTGDIHCQLKSH